VIQIEHGRISPQVGAVMDHIDRHIPNYMDTLPVAIGLQSNPLLKEEILKKLHPLDQIMAFQCPGLDGLRHSVSKPCRPFGPDSTLLLIFEGKKEGNLIEPMGVLFAEGPISIRGPISLETFIGALEENLLICHDAAKIDPLFMKGRRSRKIPRIEKTLLSKELRTNEEGTPCEGGSAMIR